MVISLVISFFAEWKTFQHLKKKQQKKQKQTITNKQTKDITHNKGVLTIKTT